MQVADQHLTRLDIIPDIDRSSVRVIVRGSASAVGLPVVVQVGNNDTAVSEPQISRILAVYWHEQVLM